MFISSLSALVRAMADEEAAADGGGKQGPAAGVTDAAAANGPDSAVDTAAPAATTGKRSRDDVLREGPSRDDVRGCGLFLDPLRKELAATRRPLR